MSYLYKGKEYFLKENVLGLLKDVAPLIRRRNQLIFDYTKKIDLKIINEYKKQIKHLQAQVTNAKEADKAQLQEQLKQKLDAFDNDPEVKAINNYYNSEIEFAMLELITDTELLKAVIPKMVNADVSEFDFDSGSIELVTFCSSVLADFFLFIQGNKNE